MESIDWSTAHKRIHRSGYVQLRKTIKGKNYDILEHIQVWQSHYGEKPKGYQIHHINENTLDNRIENLILLSPVEHGRLHSGRYKLINSVWWKLCRDCQEYKVLIDDFYSNSKQLSGGHICKKCDNNKSCQYREQQLRDNKENYVQRNKENNKKYRLKHKSEDNYLLRKKEAQKRYLLKKKESKGENNEKVLPD